MAGLFIKEMKLREAIDRILILCLAPLTIQWQDELLRWTCCQAATLHVSAADYRCA
jgi:hypothetical protein